MGLDHAFPLSDHCDFDELVGMVKSSNADKVFTVYGHATEFAEHLRKMGIDASPLPGAQKSLSEYMKGD
jgi:putative mRNA 3-end processing factor